MWRRSGGARKVRYAKEIRHQLEGTEILLQSPEPSGDVPVLALFSFMNISLSLRRERQLAPTTRIVCTAEYIGRLCQIHSKRTQERASKEGRMPLTSVGLCPAPRWSSPTFDDAFDAELRPAFWNE